MRSLILLLTLSVLGSAASGPPPERLRPARYVYTFPTDLPQPSPNGSLEPWIQRFTTDLEDMHRFYATPWSEARRNALGGLYRAWQDALGGVDFDTLSQDGKVDYLVFR